MARQNRSVMIDGVEYRPVSEGSPNAEQIARAIMEEFWGELPEGNNWEGEAESLFVSVSESNKDGEPSVMTVVGRILARMTNQTANLGEPINESM